MKRICFICTGNTCRSPMAEKIFNELAKQKGIKGIKAISAGLSCEENENMNILAKRALKTLGYSAGNKKSKQLKRLEKDTLYITMTNQQKQALDSKQVVSISDMTNCNDILDPFGGDQQVYDICAKEIETSVKIIIEKIEKLI